jgi:hypothetical protein
MGFITKMYPILSDDILMTHPNHIKEFQEFIITMPTQENIQRYVRELHDIHCINSKCKLLPPCFWSCRDGRKIAKMSTDYCTDDDCMIISSLFKYCSALNKINFSELLVELSFSISRAYASLSKDKAILFMGSDKSTEAPGFHLYNNLWSAELPILMSKLRNGELQDIVLKIINNDTVVRELSMKNDVIDLPLWRRNWHPLDGDNKNIFVDNCKVDSDYDKWRLEPPRSYVRYSTLKNVASKWISLIK